MGGPALQLLGLVLILTGVCLVAPPAALVLAGLLLVAVPHFLAAPTAASTPDKERAR